MPQVNSIAASLKATFGIEEIVTGAVLSVLLGLIILGGIKRIAAVTEKAGAFDGDHLCRWSALGDRDEL